MHGVQSLRNETVRPFEKLRKARFWVTHHSVPMIGHHANSMQVNAGFFSGCSYAVADNRIRELGWSKQELALRAAASDEVEGAGEYLSRCGHPLRSAAIETQLRDSFRTGATQHEPVSRVVPG